MSRLPREKVSQGEIHKMLDERGVVRLGATVDPNQRASKYQSEGYIGTMFVAKTENMKQAEDRMLNQYDLRHNVQQQSNAPEAPGYVYAIKGQKRSK